MKTIKLLILLHILICISSCNDKDKDIQRVIGTYYLEEMCEDHLSGYVFTDERVVVIKESSKYGLLVNIGTTHDFNAFMSNDSLFIPLQKYTIFDGSQASFQGEGEIKNDSLFLHYKNGSTVGLIECDCKGKKVD